MLQCDGLVLDLAGRRILRGHRLEMSVGERVAMIGPSGCGKTTLLRVICGLMVPASGRVMIEGTDVTSLPAEARDVGMVFQKPLLLPHHRPGEPDARS